MTDHARWLADVIADAAEDGEQTGAPHDPLTAAALDHTLQGLERAARLPDHESSR